MIRGRLTKVIAGEERERWAIVISGVAIQNHYGETCAGTWEGLLDSGADRTAVPESAVKELRLKNINKIFVRGYDQKRTSRPVFHCRLVIPGLGSMPLNPVAVESKYLLLGRDFLDAFNGLLLVADHSCGLWALNKSSVWRRSLCRLSRLI
jgi:hypothetical protein